MEENLFIELKESDKFLNEDSVEWGKVIIGMANRYGGKIYIGKKDDGTNEGFHIFDKFSEDGKSGIDKLKEKIEAFCKDRITPSILCDLDHKVENDGELLIINVPRRKELPYAYRDQIRRTYYIKNSHGTDPVTDDTLISWLYNEGNFYLNKEFYSLIHFNKNKIIPLSDYQNSCMFLLPGMDLSNRILFSLYRELAFDNSTQQEIVSFLFPYLILLSLNEKISNNWHIKDNNTDIAGRITSLKEEAMEVDIDSLLRKNIEIAYDNNCHKIMKEIHLNGIPGLEKITVPVDTKVFINHNKIGGSFSSVIKLENPQFAYKITSEINAYSAALDGPIYRTILKSMMNCNMKSDVLKDNQNYETYQFLVTTESEFLFLEHQRYEFNKINDFIELLNRTIQENWDYYYLIENISPVTLLYSIENKLNQVIKKLD